MFCFALASSILVNLIALIIEIIMFKNFYCDCNCFSYHEVGPRRDGWGPKGWGNKGWRRPSPVPFSLGVPHHSLRAQTCTFESPGSERETTRAKMWREREKTERNFGLSCGGEVRRRVDNSNNPHQYQPQHNSQNWVGQSQP